MDKPTLLLGLAIFLASAPNPDSEAVAELTANFIVPARTHVLEAARQPDEPRSLDTLTLASREGARALALEDSRDAAPAADSQRRGDPT